MKPYWRSPRKRTESSIRKIADSITKFGWRQPIAVDENFTVIRHPHTEQSRNPLFA